MNPIETLDETLQYSVKSEISPKKPPRLQNTTSLLKIRKNSKSLGSESVREIKFLYYDPSIEHTYEFKNEFSEEFTIGELIIWVVKQVNVAAKQHYQPSEVKLYLPKKKLGRPNEDFPYITTIKETNQLSFALKIEPKEKKMTITPRSSYHNSLVNRKSQSEQKPKKQPKPYYCFCGIQD